MKKILLFVLGLMALGNTASYGAKLPKAGEGTKFIVPKDYYIRTTKITFSGSDSANSNQPTRVLTQEQIRNSNLDEALRSSSTQSPVGAIAAIDVAATVTAIPYGQRNGASDSQNGVSIGQDQEKAMLDLILTVYPVPGGRQFKAFSLTLKTIMTSHTNGQSVQGLLTLYKNLPFLPKQFKAADPLGLERQAYSGSVMQALLNENDVVASSIIPREVGFALGQH